MNLCQVPTCPTRPRKVRVGGCCVCLERCQKLFDAGKDPTKMGKLNNLVSKLISDVVENIPSQTETAESKTQDEQTLQMMAEQVNSAFEERGLNAKSLDKEDTKSTTRQLQPAGV